MAVVLGDRPGRPWQVGRQVIDGEACELDTGSPDQRRPRVLDRFGELRTPAGQDER
ncbi:hypothetical protein NKH18_18850 [Streptomyces sp. M10(2022)]